MFKEILLKYPQESEENPEKKIIGIFSLVYANVFKAIKLTVDGKKVLDLSDRNYGFGRGFGYMGFCYQW